MNSIVCLRAVAVSVVTALCLAGCNPPQTTIAWVNNDAIPEREYYDRVLAVTSIPETLNTDAGGMTMINMIRDRLTDQLARQRKAVPSEEDVNAAVEYQILMDPATSAALSAGKLSRQDLVRQKRFEIEAFGIGTDGDQATQEQLDKAYNEYRDKQIFHVKASYTCKLMQVPDEAIGNQVIAVLKQTGDFKTAAQKIVRMSPLDATNAAKEQRLFADQVRPELREALDKLKPGEITPAPIAVRISDPNQPLNSQQFYAVAQLKSKEPDRTLSKIDVGFLLKPIALQKTHGGWKEHYSTQLADFTKTSKIRVAIPRYEGLVDTFVLPHADAEGTNAAGIPSAPHPTVHP